MQAFSTEEILKLHIKDYFEINGKQRIIIPKKCEYVKFKSYDRKIKPPFMIYTNFESISVPEDNGKQNPKEFYKNKHQKNIAFCYGHKLVCVDDKFSEPFKTYLDKDAVYNFINSMIEESKYFSEVMKKYFNKELKKLWFPSYYEGTGQIQSSNKFCIKWIRKIYKRYYQ